ncbi:14132_t:CDS:1, partial [Acaulospora colombiana]
DLFYHYPGIENWVKIGKINKSMEIGEGRWLVKGEEKETFTSTDLHIWDLRTQIVELEIELDKRNNTRRELDEDDFKDLRRAFISKFELIKYTEKLQEELQRLKNKNEIICEELLCNKNIDEQHKERLDKIISLVNRKTLAEQLNKELQEENNKVKELYNQLKKEFNDIIPYQKKELENLKFKEQVLENRLSSFKIENKSLNKRNKKLETQIFEMGTTLETSTLEYEDKIKGLNKILKRLTITFEARISKYETKVNELNEELKKLKKYEQISQKIIDIFKRRKTQEK